MDTLEELTEDRVDRIHVERRVDDWRRRIVDLYADIAAWLPSGWTSAAQGSVSMHEELMRRFGMPQQELPVLGLYFNARLLGQLKPYALWIIGNNGRIDFSFSERHYLVIDRSESFDPPEWKVSSILDRREQRFDCQSLLDILG